MERKIGCNLQKLNNTIMGKELNIAEILKDKPNGTKLYTDAFGELSIEDVCTEDEQGITLLDKDRVGLFFYNDGRYSIFGEPILVPSKEMRDWNKFAWKKGDVLVNNIKTIFIIFNEFEDDTYGTFKGKYCLTKISSEEEYTNEESNFSTSLFEKANDDAAQTYINTIEGRLGGKLNRETLEVEKPQPEFKDGDILYITDRIVSCNFIMIYKNQEGDRIYHYATLPEDNLVIMTKRGFLSDNGGLSKRYATEEEKQQLFEALAKEGKAWDAEKKAIVDMKPKCEFKPFDRCIWKIRNCEGSIWQASFVSYVDEYGATPIGMSIDEDLVNLIILPYNDETAKLIGTTNNWES